MKILYHCFGGTHSSVTAAAIHLGWVDPGNPPGQKELQNIPHFDTRDGEQRGYITFMGSDDKGHHVYIVGRTNMPQVLINLINGLASVFNINGQTFKFVNVMSEVNTTMRIGGLLSRKFKLVTIGRPLVTLGTIKAIPHLAKLVEKVKAEIGEDK